MTKLPFFPTGARLLLTLLSSLPFFAVPQLLPAERDALLSFKRAWADPPALRSWTAASSPCEWPEIRCAGDGFVSGIVLNNYNLSGSIPNTISALSRLTVLDLGLNLFTGEFPSAVLNCSILEYLDLSQNYFVGNVPADIGRLEALQYLDLSGNNFTGDVPSAVGSLTRLRTLNLHANLFNGSYPVEISNLANLEYLRMAYNDFRPAVIPPEFGKLRNIKYLWMTRANVIGEMPESFANLSALEHFDLSMNNMEGQIPGGLFLLKNLTNVYLYHNRFAGTIPPAIESSNLIQLDLSINNLTGRIPEDLGKLKKLEILHLYANNLHGEVPHSIALIPTLTNFRVFKNNLSGVLPPDMGIHSKLESFEVSENNFTGNLPDNLCSKGTLFGVVAFKNSLTGEIPESLGNCSSLRTVQLYGNSLSGEVPLGIWSNPNMLTLMLSDNSFSGDLPSNLAWNLTRLEIKNNRFSGVIPQDVSSWASLIVLEASNNEISGQIPQGLTSLNRLTTLALDGNSLSGELPSGIISWKSLTTVNLARNKLSGRISPEFSSLQDLRYLDLSENQFSGEIPAQLELLKLSSLNLSSNKLTGQIPYELDNMAFENSFLNNPGLCSLNAVSNLPSCHAKSRESKKMSPEVLAVVLVLVLALLLVAIVMTLFLVRDHRRRKLRRHLALWKLTSFQRLGFSKAKILSSIGESNVIGCGSSGQVFKVAMDRDGPAVAVKRIWGNKDADNFLEKAFLAEIQILGSIRHSNIVKLLCCISSDDCKLLVYEYVENQSLDRWLHGKKRIALDWPTRLRIAIGAAQGLCYMHHSCTPSIIHRDVKSSNILLDAEFNAKVADFGLAKVLIRKGEANTVSAVAGSFGYIAPEYGYTTKVDEKVDVYSFGVVLLELVTGREAHHGDNEHAGLVDWAYKHCQWRPFIDAIDEEIKEACFTEEIIDVFKVALVCVSPSPASRPSMKEVLQILQQLRSPDREDGKKVGKVCDVSPLLGSGKYAANYRCDSAKLVDGSDGSLGSLV